MTNTENCGWPTGDGHACLNPATEDNGRCWIPSHGDPDADNPQGRPFTITPSDHDAILNAARNGLSERGCARAAGTNWPQLNRYLDAHPEFRSSFAQAREQGEEKLVTGGLYGEADPSMAKFLLSTSFGYVKTEKRELEHSGDSGIVIHTTASESAEHGDD